MTENKDLDMFKLAEEVAKQNSANKKEETEVQADLDSIFSDLDSITNSYEKSEESVRVIKPALPNNIGDYTTRYEAFKCLVEAVSYGRNNSEEYVKGHKDALEKFSQSCYQNRKNMSVYEDELNREIADYPSRYKLYEKGYYDGMFFILKAIKRSKELAMDNLVKELRAEL